MGEKGLTFRMKNILVIHNIKPFNTIYSIFGKRRSQDVGSYPK